MLIVSSCVCGGVADPFLDEAAAQLGNPGAEGVVGPGEVLGERYLVAPRCRAAMPQPTADSGDRSWVHFIG